MSRVGSRSGLGCLRSGEGVGRSRGEVGRLCLVRGAHPTVKSVAEGVAVKLRRHEVRVAECALAKHMATACKLSGAAVVGCAMRTMCLAGGVVRGAHPTECAMRNEERVAGCDCRAKRTTNDVHVGGRSCGVGTHPVVGCAMRTCVSRVGCGAVRTLRGSQLKSWLLHEG